MPPHEHSSWYTPGLLAGIKLLLLLHRMFLMLRPDLKATLNPAFLKFFSYFWSYCNIRIILTTIRTQGDLRSDTIQHSTGYIQMVRR